MKITFNLKYFSFFENVYASNFSSVFSIITCI